MIWGFGVEDGLVGDDEGMRDARLGESCDSFGEGAASSAIVGLAGSHYNELGGQADGKPLSESDLSDPELRASRCVPG